MRGADAYGLQPFEDPDGLRAVVAAVSRFRRLRPSSGSIFTPRAPLLVLPRIRAPLPACRSAQRGWAVVTRAWPRRATSVHSAAARSSSSSESRSSSRATAGVPCSASYTSSVARLRASSRLRHWPAEACSAASAAVDGERDRIAVRPHQRAARPSLVAAARRQLLGQAPLLARLARRPAAGLDARSRSVSPSGRKARDEAGPQPRDVTAATVAQRGSERDQPLVPGLEAGPRPSPAARCAAGRRARSRAGPAGRRATARPRPGRRIAAAPASIPGSP